VARLFRMRKIIGKRAKQSMPVNQEAFVKDSLLCPIDNGSWGGG